MPEFEPLATRNSAWTSRSANFSLEYRSLARPPGPPVTITPSPSSGTSRFGFLGSSFAPPANSHPVVGPAQPAKALLSDRTVQPPSSARAGTDAASTTVSVTNRGNEVRFEGDMAAARGAFRGRDGWPDCRTAVAGEQVGRRSTSARTTGPADDTCPTSGGSVPEGGGDDGRIRTIAGR